MMSSPHTVEALRSRFAALWERCQPTQRWGEPAVVWEQLAGRYTEAHRHYHGISHLVHCLEQHDLAAAHMDDPDAVEMAIWFHDAVMDPRARDNELRSAHLFRTLAADLFDKAFVDRVCELVLATAHGDPPTDCDDRFIMDIDLSSLGSTWDRYLRDSLALRREDPEIPEDRFRGAQRSFLTALCERERIFHTDFFHRRYENRARRNIERYLRQL